jgi:DNA-directed RNA polymerase subunit F
METEMINKNVETQLTESAKNGQVKEALEMLEKEISFLNGLMKPVQKKLVSVCKPESLDTLRAIVQQEGMMPSKVNDQCELAEILITFSSKIASVNNFLDVLLNAIEL